VLVHYTILTDWNKTRRRGNIKLKKTLKKKYFKYILMKYNKELSKQS